MDDYHKYCPLTGDELKTLYGIAAQMRQLTEGMPRRRGETFASVLARRSGTRRSGSLRAILSLIDIRRPRPETFQLVADGVGRPELAATWQAAWDAIDHPAHPKPDRRSVA